MDVTTATTGASLIPDTTHLFTGGAFLLIAILTALTIAGIVFGMRLSHRRRKAERELSAHNEQVEERGPDIPVRFDSEERREDDAVPVAAPPPVPPAPPIPTVAPVSVEPIAAPAPPPGPSPADGLVTQLKGLGPKVAQRLADHGITTVGQLAALTDDQADDLDAHMGPFTGRMGRDRWLEQARFLAAGDRAGFEAVFGRL